MFNIFSILFLSIAIHEFGHLLMCFVCKVKADEYAIGFGRKLFGFDFKGTHYALRMIPFGGFVQMNTDSYTNSSRKAKVAICLGGPLINIITFSLIIIGLFTYRTNDIGAAILGFLSITPDIASSFSTAASNPDNLQGPIGILTDKSASEVIQSPTKAFDWINYLSVLASINLSLAISNLFPLPMLDGGQVVTIVMDKYFSKFPIILKVYTIGGNFILGLLLVGIMSKDIWKLINPLIQSLS